MSSKRSRSVPKVRHPWILLLVIVAASFAVRLAYVVQLESMPTFDSPTMDEGYHLELATQINSPQGYPPEPYFRAPLYPYFLAALWNITNHSFFGVRLIQILLGSLVPLLIYLLGARLFDRKIALWSACIAALYPTLIYYDASLLITVLEVLLSTLLLYLLYRCDGKSLWPLIAAGVVLGLAGLARPNLLVVGPPLILWAWFVLKPKVGLKKALTSYVVVGVCTVLVILPVTIRNYVAAHDFVTIAWQGGYNFYVGNNHAANGWSARVEGIDPCWNGGYFESIAIAEKETGRPLKKSEISDYWTKQAFQDVAANPAHFLSLLIAKVRLLINGYEVPNNQDEYVAKEFSSVLDILLWRGPLYFPYGLLAPLGIMGLVISFREWRKFLLVYLFMASFAVSLVLFFVCARYRQPFIPFLILFSVYGIITLVRHFKTKNYRTAWLYVLLVGVLAIESNHDLLNLNAATVRAENSDLIGNAYFRKQQLDLALTEYRKGIAADPTYGRGYNNIGAVLTRQKRCGEAVGYLKMAMQLDTRLSEPYINLSICYSEARDTANAVRILEQARSQFPNNSYVHCYLAMAYIDEARFNDAIVSATESVRLDPSNTNARQLLQELQSHVPKR